MGQLVVAGHGNLRGLQDSIIIDNSLPEEAERLESR
jgi:hypothetical protein